MFFFKVNAILMIIIFLIFSLEFSFVQNCGSRYEPIPLPTNPPDASKCKRNPWCIPTNKCILSTSKLLSGPFILSHTASNDFIYPQANTSSIELNEDQLIIFSCANANIKIDNHEIQPTLEAYCNSDETFNISIPTTNSFQTVKFSSLSCSGKIIATSESTGKQCGHDNNHEERQIGFHLGNQRFARQLLVCFDRRSLTPVYVMFRMASSVNQALKHSRTSFIEDKYIYNNVNINKAYTKLSEQSTINSLLGLPENSEKYIQKTGNRYLARGHLAAKTDFLYPSQQDASFYYTNVVPQWQLLNCVNWLQIEKDVRDYAQAKNVELEVYTGVYGVSTLPHTVTKVETKLFLIPQQNRVNLVPVPELFWKVVYNRVNKTGVAIIGNNNPYLEKDKITKLCSHDVFNQLSWLNIGRNDKFSCGYIYACTVENLKKIVRDLPSFPVNGVLN